MMHQAEPAEMFNEFNTIHIVINCPAMGISWKKNQAFFNCIFSTMHQVLYNGINAFHGADAGFSEHSIQTDMPKNKRDNK